MAGYCVLDVVLVVDTSSSVRENERPGVDNFELFKQFLGLLVDPPMEVGPYYDHVALVQFSSSAQTLFDLSQRTTLDSVKRGFNLLPRPHGETNTPDGINLALQVSRLLFSACISRRAGGRTPARPGRGASRMLRGLMLRMKKIFF